ncbi:hypothetical protein GLOIN_2v1725482 [Rhizophagus irregularis DAOM 181602=DAOM 197198]|nr:hypothetical protein GLOIN_2v1725482 [Rhizophagus irregularis DAOM 181602=DAOM 197198]
MSETSTPYTPASTITFGNNETVSLADEIKKYDTAKLIEYLREQNLNLVKDDFDIIENERVGGQDFFDLTQEELERHGMKLGPAKRLVNGDITRIPQFIPPIHTINESAPEFKLCIDDILRRIKNMGPVVDSNEAMRCEYISTILHTAVSILGDLVITPQANIIGEENTGRVDYAIKKIISELLEEIICITEGKQNQATMGICQNLLQCRSACDMNINMNKKKRKVDEAFDPDYDYVYGIVSTGTDWYFILHSTEGIYSTSRTEYRISLTEGALKDDTELRH